MNKKSIINLLNKNYSEFINFINDLTTKEFESSQNQKWSAGQQLKHIVLCVKPIVQAFSLDTVSIGQRFGTTNRIGYSYEDLVNQYKVAAKNGGKAPERFVPEIVLKNEKKILTESLILTIQTLSVKIENFTEQELDTLCLPHPLLGTLTLRELLYNTIEHVKHHQESIKKNLMIESHIETDRLLLSKLTSNHATFILELLNTEEWKKFIADRDIQSITDAEKYIDKILNDPNVKYWIVNTKNENTPIGIISLIKRDFLQYHDIGFALLPQFSKKGYAFEAAQIVLKETMKSSSNAIVFATTVKENINSIRLLEKLELKFYDEIEVDEEKLLVYKIINE